MAHAYTTKRGKNKMGKLGVRRDSQQNAENNLKTPTSTPLKFTEPKENPFGGNITDGTNSVRLRLQDKISAKQASISSESSNAAIETLTTSNSCHYSGCLNLSSIDNDNAKLMDCASCRSARYCSRDCQVNDWVNHKTLCKEIKKKLMEMAKIEEMLGMDRVDMNKDNQPSESDEIEDNLN